MADRKLGIDDLDMNARKFFRRELDEHGSVGRDQIKLEKIDEIEDEDGIVEIWAIDIYDPELYNSETVIYHDEEEAREDYGILLSLCNDTKIFKIPCSWQMYGHIEVRAESLEEAVSNAESSDCELPIGSYIENSFEVDYAAVSDMEDE